MAMYFASRASQINDMKDILPYKVVQKGGLTELFVYKLKNAEEAIMVKNDVIAIKTKNAYIFPLWAHTLYGQGHSNEAGIIVETAIVPAKNVERVCLNELKQTFGNFLYWKPKRVKVDEVLIAGGTVSINALIEGKSYDLDPERVKEVLARYRTDNYSCFA